jgi:hypothetical protein
MRTIRTSEQDQVLAVLERHRERLLALAGVHYVDVGYKYVGGQPTDELAVRVHVPVKRPEALLAIADLALEEIEGIPVDVLVTNPVPAAADAGVTVFDRRTGAVMTLSREGADMGEYGAGDHGVTALDHPLIGTRVARSGPAGQVVFGVVDGVSGPEFTIVPDPGRTPRPGPGVVSAARAIWRRADAVEVGLGLHRAAEPSEAAEPSTAAEATEAAEPSEAAETAEPSGPSRPSGPEFRRAWAIRLIQLTRSLDIRFRRLPAVPLAGGDDIAAGEALNINQAIMSANGRYLLLYQGDGDLVLYDGGTPGWSTGTAGSPPGVVIMRADGELVVRDPDVAVWSSGTGGNPGSRLVVRDDGELVIVRPDGEVVWSRPGVPLETRSGRS